MRRGHTSDPDHAGVRAATSRPHRVPAVSKEEVDRQITELLSMRLIRRSESDSPMTIPIVCVADKDGGVRTACDYCYRNFSTKHSSNIVADWWSRAV